MVLIFWIACKGVEPAPADVDSLCSYLWRNFDLEDDAALQEGIRSLHSIMDADAFEDVIDGSISNLQEEDLVAVGKEGAERLSGVFFVNKVGCPLEQVEKNVYSLKQDELHPGTYDSYFREYTSDFEAYTNREEDFLSWDTTYAVSGFGYAYEASLSNRMRYSAKENDADFADLFISRAVLNAPAYFDEGSTERGMFQDYQLELFYKLNESESFHLFAIWREMTLIGDVSFASESAQRLVLDGLLEWDDDHEINCP